MPRRRTVPVTAAVVDWAIRESGYSLDELAKQLRVPPETLRAWAVGTELPGLTQLRALAAKLKRPLAAFLLPEPPASPRPAVAFRSPPGAERRELNPVERRYLREAGRLQRFLSWVAKELGEQPVVLPRERTDADPEVAAARVRARVGVTLEQQERWTSASAAFTAWRHAVEDEGVLVFALSMGSDSCRGFSLWDDFVPLVAVNTAWLTSARIFTLFHEYGHLATRTDSACLQSTRRWGARALDDPERWCEAFSAALLMPSDAVREYVAQRHDRRPGALISAVATYFSVSHRAAALRLVDLGYITWDDYEDLPAFEPKPSGGGKGRDRTQLREDQYGNRTARLVGRALERDVIGRGDVLDYFDVPESAIDRFTSTSAGE